MIGQVVVITGMETIKRQPCHRVRETCFRTGGSNYFL